MLAHTPGATDGPGGRSAHIDKAFTGTAQPPSLRVRFKGEDVRRAAALILFVFGESVIASLSFGVAAVPALLTFLAGGMLLIRSG
jgi:hypothetical protein